MAISYPLINGTRHDFSSIELKLAGQIFLGFKATNYKRTRTRTMVRGNHPDPIGKTKGTNEYTGDVEMYLAEWDLFQSTLLAEAERQGVGYGDVFFQVIATYSSNGFDTIVDTLNGCTCDSLDASNTQGNDPLVRKIDLNPIKILFNGKDDVDPPLAAPAGS